MMTLELHRSFKEKFQKMPQGVKDSFRERIDLFKVDPFHPLLNNHPLSGKYEGSRSINITGDYRAIFEVVDNQVAIFYDIDTHSKLYRS